MKRLLIALMLLALPICSQAQLVMKVATVPTEAAKSGHFRVYYNSEDNYYFLSNGLVDDPAAFAMKLGVFKRTTITSLEQMMDMAKGKEDNRYFFYNGFDGDCIARKGTDFLLRTCVCIRDKRLNKEVRIPVGRLEALASQMEEFDVKNIK